MPHTREDADAPSRPMLEVPARALRAKVTSTVWSPRGLPDDLPLPLLVVHDGTEYAAKAGLARYLAAGVRSGMLPPLRAALLSPGTRRDEWYSANPRYSATLARVVLPAVTRTVATTTRVGMGTSLGALAMLHLHRQHSRSLDALFLQSGSFFRPQLDPQERRLPQFGRITRFVGRMQRTPATRPLPAVLTCGADEENLANNRLMTQALRAQGYAATLYETPGRHDWSAWREAFDPCLTEVLTALPEESGADETRQH